MASPIGNLETMWNQWITSSRLPSELYSHMPASASINIDARRIHEVYLPQQSLQDLQAQNKELMNVAESVIHELAGIVTEEIFIVLCNLEGAVMLAANTLTGCVCPGAMADEGRVILHSMQDHCLPELTIYWDQERCLGGFFKSVVFPVRDISNEIKAILSIGSLNGDIAGELRMAVYLGASLIEMRYRYRQTIKTYADSVVDALPELALLINESGDIQSVSRKLIKRLGESRAGRLIGKSLNTVVQEDDRVGPGHMIEPNTSVVLNIDDQPITCRILHHQFIPDPLGGRQQLLLMTEEATYGSRKDLFAPDGGRQNGFDRLVGQSAAIAEIRRFGQKVAASAFTVLISGESGTGKELLAQAIHQGSGRRGPFSPINCGAIPKELLQSELFGYTEGSFTGGQKGGRKGKLASADGGTVFLDEIGEMPLEMQVSLLRFMQDRIVTRIGEDYGRKVDVRVIAATNRNLFTEVNENRFRQDLYYRLNEISIHMPALRERLEDIPELTVAMLAAICEEHRLPVPQIEEAAVRCLCDHDWPGNCRELQNILKSALVHMEGDLITREILLPLLAKPGTQGEQEESLEYIEKNVILNRVKACNGNISEAASSLQINRSTLYRKLKYYNGKN